MVPSSTTVTPWAATRWPSRPAKAEVPLRLKSPSSPWPTASCSMHAGPAGAQHHGPSRRPGRDRVQLAARAWRSASSATPCHLPGLEQASSPNAAAAAVAAALAPAVPLDHHADVEPHQRAEIGAAARRRRARSPPPDAMPPSVAVTLTTAGSAGAAIVRRSLEHLSLRSAGGAGDRVSRRRRGLAPGCAGRHVRRGRSGRPPRPGRLPRPRACRLLAAGRR